MSRQLPFLAGSEPRRPTPPRSEPSNHAPRISASGSPKADSAVAPPPNASLRPPLKWAGGKRWLLPELRPIWAAQPFDRLVEPFAGGLAVSLGLTPKRALIGDINPHTINLYRWIQRGLMPRVPLENNRQTFYLNRARFNELVHSGKADSMEAAELFYYLNRTGFNGLCRFNRSGEFNVPFGRYKRIAYITDWSDYSRRLAAWEFHSGDFETLRVGRSDFIYADPPYDVEFTQYSKEGFSWADQVRLVDWLDCHDGPIVLSNQATPRVIKLYRSRGYRLRFLLAPRLISCDGNRAPAREVLAVKGVR